MKRYCLTPQGAYRAAASLTSAPSALLYNACHCSLASALSYQIMRQLSLGPAGDVGFESLAISLPVQRYTALHVSRAIRADATANGVPQVTILMKESRGPDIPLLPRTKQSPYLAVTRPFAISSVSSRATFM